MILWIFIGVALLMLLVGWLAGRKEGVEDYNIYGRRLPSWLYSITYAATYMGAGFFIAGTAYAYQYGWAFLMVFAGYAVGLLIFGRYSRWLRQQTKGKRYYNLPDYFRQTFGPGTGKVLAVILLLLLAGDLSIQFISGGKIFTALGVAPYFASMAITIIIIGAYLMLSGFRAVVWTDAVLLAFVTLLSAGVAALLAPSVITSTAIFETTPITIIAGFFLYGIFGPFASAVYYQRIFAGKSDRHAEKGTIISLVWVLVPAVAIGFLGFAAHLAGGVTDPDLAFMAAIGNGGDVILYLGSLLLWVCLMSTADTLSFVGSQLAVHDIARRPLTKQTTRVGLVLVLLAGLLISVLVPSVMRVGLLFLGGGMAIAVPAMVHWRFRLSGGAVSAALIVSLIGSICYAIVIALDPTLVLVGIVLSALTLAVVSIGEKLILQKA